MMALVLLSIVTPLQVGYLPNTEAMVSLAVLGAIHHKELCHIRQEMTVVFVSPLSLEGFLT